jgi:type IV pilus assembly protein PilY1
VTSAWPNGLSTPAAVDVNGDRVIDYVYAGDLHGSLWKFDLTAKDSTAWKVAFDGEPLYRTRTASGQAQPISLRPEVVRGANGLGVFVLFAAGNAWSGTGTPRSAEHETFYGIADTHDRIMLHRNELSPRNFVAEFPLRSAAPFLAARTVGAQTEHGERGWYLDLPSADRDYLSERVVANPVVRDGRVSFMTNRARKIACGRADNVFWLLSIDILGIDDSRPVFDLNMDGQVNAADTLRDDSARSTGPLPAHGVAWATSLTGASGSIATLETFRTGRPCARLSYVPAGAQTLLTILQSCHGARGRQSWRQVR